MSSVCFILSFGWLDRRDSYTPPSANIYIYIDSNCRGSEISRRILMEIQKSERKLPISLKNLDLNTNRGEKKKINVSAYLSSSRKPSFLKSIFFSRAGWGVGAGFWDCFCWFASVTGNSASKSGPPSLVSLCLGVVGRHLEEISPCLADISLILPAEIKVSDFSLPSIRLVLFPFADPRRIHVQ